MTAGQKGAETWATAWLDALAFAVGLGMAWWLDWKTPDLVWSLWLSSLCVGYSLIVWAIFRPLLGLLLAPPGSVGWPGPPSGSLGAYLGMHLFVLAFFTVHFGGFHLGHSVFLHLFFPLEPGGESSMPGLAMYAEVFSRYWFWLPVAFLAERQAFQGWPSSGKVANHPAMMAPLAGNAMVTPYKNVIRMHILIFFFAFASIAKLDNFLVYAAVYAVYFFPWRLLSAARRRPP